MDSQNGALNLDANDGTGSELNIEGTGTVTVNVNNDGTLVVNGEEKVIHKLNSLLLRQVGN